MRELFWRVQHPTSSHSHLQNAVLDADQRRFGIPDDERMKLRQVTLRFFTSRFWKMGAAESGVGD